jgi:hypothetical protein
MKWKWVGRRWTADGAANGRNNFPTRAKLGEIGFEFFFETAVPLWNQLAAK